MWCADAARQGGVFQPGFTLSEPYATGAKALPILSAAPIAGHALCEKGQEPGTLPAGLLACLYILRTGDGRPCLDQFRGIGGPVKDVGKREVAHRAWLPSAACSRRRGSRSQGMGSAFSPFLQFFITHPFPSKNGPLISPR